MQILVLLGDFQQFDGLVEQAVTWKVSVAFAARFFQRVEQACLQAGHGVERGAQLLGDFVGAGEADAPDFLAQQVGVLFDGQDGGLAIVAPQAQGGAAGDLVAVQEQQRFTAVAHGFPAGEEGI